jgi:hypothetical protein
MLSLVTRVVRLEEGGVRVEDRPGKTPKNISKTKSVSWLWIDYLITVY